MDIVPRKPRIKTVFNPHPNTPEQRQRHTERQMFAQAYHKKLHANNENRCIVCGWTPPPMLELLSVRGNKPSIIELHHILPVAVGGTDTEENVIPLCPNHHRIADLLAGMSDIGGRKAVGITSRERLIEMLTLLDTDPDACMSEIRRIKLEHQSEVTDMLSDLLSQ